MEFFLRFLERKSLLYLEIPNIAKFLTEFSKTVALYIVIDKDDKSLFFSLTLSTLLPDHKTINIKGKILSSSVVMIF